MNIPLPATVFQHTHGTMVKDANGRALCVMGTTLTILEATEIAERLVACLNAPPPVPIKKERKNATTSP